MRIEEARNGFRRSVYRRLRPLGGVALIVAACQVLGCATGPRMQEPLVVFLVRHAEKVDTSRDTELSVAGGARARELARSLRDAKIQHVHSSDFIRTRDTAAPIATELGLEVELYDPGNLHELVEYLKESGGRHLVVGHSTTTPSVVELLGGEPGSAIDDRGEYDRLYVVTLRADGAVSTVLMRYGRTFTGE